MNLKVYDIVYQETDASEGSIAGVVVSYDVVFSDQGVEGPVGPTGPIGPSNVLSIGTVTTGAPGSGASATISGTSPSQTLNLTIPRGDVGATGATGPVGPQANINYTVVTTAQTLSNSQNIAADTSGGAFTLTLPSNPSNGDAIDIFDYAGTFDTNNLTIARNGTRIEGLEENLVCNVEGAYFTIIYGGSTNGWQIIPRFGTSGGGGESVLTTQGDTLYRASGVNARLPIGTAGQVLKVNSGATAPEWGTISTALNFEVKTANYTALTNEKVAADTTSGAWTLTLPATPSNGDTVTVLDYAGTFDTNNLTIARNGSNIESLAENMICEVEDAAFTLVYVGSTVGWKVVPYQGTAIPSVRSDATGITGASAIDNIVTISQANYNALGSYDAGTVYIITDP